MDPEVRKRALRGITYGLYVVSTRKDDQVNAFTGNWLTQISFEPPLVALAVKKGTRSMEYIEASKVFTVNILESGQTDIAVTFFKHVEAEGNKFGDLEFYYGENGCPILKDALSYFGCKVVHSWSGGDHCLYVGEVTEVGVHRSGDPLTLRETGFNYGG